MTVRQVAIPDTFNITNTIAFIKEVAALPTDILYLGLDFSAWMHVNPYELPLKPFGMLVISQAIHQYRTRNPNATIVAMSLPDNSIESYAAHMGFFGVCGIDIQKPYGDAQGSMTYLPITRVEKPGLMHGAEIETLSLKLAQQLTQNTNGALVNTLTYTFTEIIRNVAEHAHSPEYWYCAQYWPSRDNGRGEAEIALLDSGRGLSVSLRNNPFICAQIVDDKTALKFALMPGISGTMWHGKAQRDDDAWQNSGFGLYMTYRICTEGGNFFIASGDTGLYCQKGTAHQYTTYHLPGVALRLRMKIDTLSHYNERYHPVFLADGEREAKEIQGGVVPTGERMSRMLRSSFSDTKE